MNLSQISLFLALLCFLITFTAGINNPTHFTGVVSINCGSTGTSAARNGREWLGDSQPKLSSLLQLKGLSAATRVIHKLTSADPVPHKTARLSRSHFSYAFQVKPGQKIIRLHFNPTQYKGFKGLRDLFTVEAGPFTLLSNFSASLNADAIGVNTFAKEFCLNIQENQQLIITFSAEYSQSLDTYAFLNGIEIISVPAGLSYFYGGGDMGLHVIGQTSLVYVDNSTALEIIHRLYIRKDYVLSGDDPSDIFGMWATLTKHEVNNINNITWKISVDVGFRYLIRLHFSKIGFKMAETGGVSFKVLINEIVANTDIVVKERDDSSLPWYGDYMVMMNGRKKEGKRNLLICLQSNEEFMDGHGPLKGFEIFKLSNPDSSLASPNPVPPAKDSPSHTIQTSLLILGHRNAIAAVAITIVSLLNIIIHSLRESWEASSSEEENEPSARNKRLCRRFSLSEIRLATKNFSDGLLIGSGGFGKVYKGLIDKGQTTVAVKRLKLNSKQGASEFLTEIETVSNLRHNNLVSLIGYCSEHQEMILVYEYMPKGTLADHIYQLKRYGNNSFLAWDECLNICIGAARGIDYLHTDLAVIHRDIKASNILLDENKVAKVSDFGIAKYAVEENKLQSHVSTKVKGTIGYLDPHYFHTGKLTMKADIYGFGVVLLEVLCGRPAVDFFSSEDERVLTSWARDKISKGEADQIVASSLREEISPNSLKIFVKVAERCLEEQPKKRPTMSQVLLQLELALEQQKSKKFAVLNHTANVANDVCPSNEDIIPSESAEQSTEASANVHVPNHTANIVNDVRPSNEDIIPSESAEQSAEASTDAQTVAPSSKQTNLNYHPVGNKDGRKLKTYSPLRFWGRDTFWNRMKPFKKIEFSFMLGIREADIKLPKFDLTSIAAATNQFSSKQRIREDESGSVYKALLPDERRVAVKRFSLSTPALEEFCNEIYLVSSLSHPNIIQLVGYCIHERREHILVYNYMAHGTLSDHLHNSKYSPLTWKQRLRICIGAAKGLHYLHTSTNHPIIHRNVTSNNILLDEKWVPRMSGLRLSKLVPEEKTSFTKLECGTPGYVDPEYLRSAQLTEKSDVYAFGVVLFEVLCARKPIKLGLPEKQVKLAEWAKFCFKEGTLEQIIDSNLNGQIAPECFSEFARIAVACLEVRGTHRPAMGDVVPTLEFAMQLQERRVEAAA